jgi:enhancer of polycomb-like protein
MDIPQMQRPPGTQLRLPVRPDGRPIDADLTLLSDVLAQKENMLQMEIDLKVQQHQRWNQNHIDLTREPLSPIRGQGKDSSFRLATAQYLLTPPASVSSESSDHPSPTQEKDDATNFRFASPPDDGEPRGKPAYRRRIGRLGRLWIDRRGLPSPAKEMDNSTFDRWKYDQDDDDEPTIYEVDPYDTKAIKFRATIPFTPALLSRRLQQEMAPIAPPIANGQASSPPARPSSSSQPPVPPT